MNRQRRKIFLGVHLRNLAVGRWLESWDPTSRPRRHTTGLTRMALVSTRHQSTLDPLDPRSRATEPRRDTPEGWDVSPDPHKSSSSTRLSSSYRRRPEDSGTESCTWRRESDRRPRSSVPVKSSFPSPLLKWTTTLFYVLWHRWKREMSRLNFWL